MALPRLLKTLLTLPTAAFREDAVLAELTAICAKLRHTTLKRDKFGNLLVRYRHDPPGTTPLIFAAHTDHPSFVASRMLTGKRLLAEFRGGVRDDYFVGSRVRFFTDGGLVIGKIGKLLADTGVKGQSFVARPKEVEITVPQPVPPDTIGMWDLPDPELRDDIVYARGCDDVAGVAALVAMLERLSRKEAAADVHVLFTRAEEIGFVGAIAAAKHRTIPKKLPVIAIENSSARAGAPIGSGPVLRVGDKATIFTPTLTAFCERVANDLAKRKKKFTFQRKLMDGGTCESTAFLAYGYEATGICVALGNYHNMNLDTGKIDSEYISLSDWQRMVDWFEALVLDRTGYGGEQQALAEHLDQRFAHYLPELARTARAGASTVGITSPTTKRPPARRVPRRRTRA